MNNSFDKKHKSVKILINSTSNPKCVSMRKSLRELVYRGLSKEDAICKKLLEREVKFDERYDLDHLFHQMPDDLRCLIAKSFVDSDYPPLVKKVNEESWIEIEWEYVDEFYKIYPPFHVISQEEAEKKEYEVYVVAESGTSYVATFTRSVPGELIVRFQKIKSASKKLASNFSSQ